MDNKAIFRETFSLEWEKGGFGSNDLCTLCLPVNLALIKYLCFLVELLTLLPPLGFSLPVSDDIQPTAAWRNCCLCVCLTQSELDDPSSFRFALSTLCFSFMVSLINYDAQGV
ncbi:hypothetical protein CRENBAI_020410 [Crenichthys baileyi]|uniref:Uncharacterized protein n=1 Tax=Crenichthys baileyi TaxID=28760 RepID=A0AAV9SAI1_9TELE